MKKILLSAGILILSVGAAVAQSEKLQSGDSVRVALEKTTISHELKLLRDSISISLRHFDSEIDRTTASEKKLKLESARKELIEYRNRVKVDLQETSLTSKNSWTQEGWERIKANMAATRREFKRLRGLL